MIVVTVYPANFPPQGDVIIYANVLGGISFLKSVKRPLTKYIRYGRITVVNIAIDSAKWRI